MSRRNRIIDKLQSTGLPLTAREISLDLGIPEATVCRDMDHIAKTLRTRDEVLLIKPATCLECGFVFKSARARSPSRCPTCRENRIMPPAFIIGPINRRRAKFQP